jgi:hypothetical protein
MMLEPLDAFESELEEELNAKSHLDCNDVIKIEPLGWVRRQELLRIFDNEDWVKP